MSSFEVGGGVAWGVACRRVAAVFLLGAYAAVFTWPVASTTSRLPPAVEAVATPGRIVNGRVVDPRCPPVSSDVPVRPNEWTTLGEFVDFEDGCVWCPGDAQVFTFAGPSTMAGEPLAVDDDQPLVDEVLGIGAGCSLVPAFEGGRAIGWKLFGVRAESLRFCAGLRNSDVIVAINERRLSTPDGLLEVYEQLRSSRTLRLDVLRAGQPLRIVVDG